MDGSIAASVNASKKMAIRRRMLRIHCDLGYYCYGMMNDRVVYFHVA